jgi:hypothetical protein
MARDDDGVWALLAQNRHKVLDQNRRVVVVQIGAAAQIGVVVAQIGVAVAAQMGRLDYWGVEKIAQTWVICHLRIYVL